MPVHMIMIRLDYDSDYSKRYSETVDAIRKQASGGSAWEEATSAYILQSPLSAKALCDAIYFDAPIFESRDMLVVINLSWSGEGNYAQRGANYPATLMSFMDAR